MAEGSGFVQEVSGGLKGVVLVGGRPLESTRVVLHRVTRTDGGEIDSTTTLPDGSFAFEMPTADSAEDVYFASVRHGGVLYHGGAFTLAALPEDYLVQAFDTVRIAGYDPTGEEASYGPPEALSAASSPRVELVGRSLFLERLTETEAWQVTDVLSLSNPLRRTIVAPLGSATWSQPLPTGAERFEVAHGEGEEGSVTMSAGRIFVAGPIPPGERLVVVAYALAAELPTFPAGDPTEWLEILIREPAPGIEVEGIPLVGLAEVTEGSTYRRYWTDRAPETATLVRARQALRVRPEWAAVVVALALVAAVSFRRGRWSS